MRQKKPVSYQTPTAGHKDKLDPRSPAWERRQQIWRHNALRGSVALARTSMQEIIRCKTATWWAVEQAKHCEESLRVLAEFLLNRDDSQLPPLPEKRKRQS